MCWNLFQNLVLTDDYHGVHKGSSNISGNWLARRVDPMMFLTFVRHERTTVIPVQNFRVQIPECEITLASRLDFASISTLLFHVHQL